MRIVVAAAALVLMATPVFADQVADLIAGTVKQCRGCDLHGANFKKADLAGVDLTGANLTDATFHRADLRGAILTGRFAQVAAEMAAEWAPEDTP